MLTRQSTLSQNIAIYLSLVVLLLIHAWFWGSWMKGAQVRSAKLTADLGRLKSEVEQLRRDTDSLKSTMEETNQKLERRAKELEEMGTFLPSIKEKSKIIGTILNKVETLGIRITNTEFPPSESSREGGGYYTVNFTLDLMGPYPAFKQLLEAIPKTAMIIRVSQFKVLSYGSDNPAYDWKVQIQFQTYFGS